MRLIPRAPRRSGFSRPRQRFRILNHFDATDRCQALSSASARDLAAELKARIAQRPPRAD